MDYTVHGILQARILEWVAIPFSRISSLPRSPASQVDSLPAEPQGKLKNAGVGSHSLLQKIFTTQESNWVSSSPGSPELEVDFFSNWAMREAWLCQGDKKS